MKMTFEVAPKLAEYIQKKGCAEIFERGANMRFLSAAKCALVDNPETQSEALQKAVETMTNMSSNSLRQLRKTCSSIEKNTLNMSTQLTSVINTAKNLSVNVDKLASLVQITQVMSFITVGLSLANMGVSIAGFVKISKQIKELDKKIETVQETLQRMEGREITDKLLNADKLMMRFNDISDIWQNDGVADLKDVQDLLNDIQSYMNNLIVYIKKDYIGIEESLDVLMVLFNVYNVLLREYIKQYFFQVHSIPTNYETYYKKIYEEFTGKEFRQILFDYFFLDHKLGLTEATDATNISTLIAVNGLTQVEDQIELMTMTETEEEYKSVDAELQLIANNMLDEALAKAS